MCCSCHRRRQVGRLVGRLAVRLVDSSAGRFVSEVVRLSTLGWLVRKLPGRFVAWRFGWLLALRLVGWQVGGGGGVGDGGSDGGGGGENGGSSTDAAIATTTATSSKEKSVDDVKSYEESIANNPYQVSLIFIFILFF